MATEALRIAAALLGGLPFAAPALAQDEPLSECRAALRADWPELVREGWPTSYYPIDLEEPVVTEPDNDALRPKLEALAQTCAEDREARNEILVLDAQRSRAFGEADRAIELLSQVDVRPGDRGFGVYQTELLKTHTAVGNIGSVMASVLDSHEQALLAQGLELERKFTVQGIAFRAYRYEDQQDGWLLIGVHPNFEIETIIAGVPSWAADAVFEDGKLPFDLTNARCSVSNEPLGDEGVDFDESIALDRIIAMLESSYGDPEREREWSRGAGVDDFCPNLATMLPGFGPRLKFSGLEYRDASAGYSEIDLMTLLQSEVPEERAEAADYVFDHPDAVEPLYLIFGVFDHMARGDRERALFWFYIWQTRTRPYMKVDSEFAQLRGALNFSIRQELLNWAGSDFDANMEVWIRAIRYELKAPLYKGRPQGVGEERWQELIAKAREDNSEEVILAVFEDTSVEEIAAERRANNRYVGPWRGTGRPLKDDWR